MTVESSVPVGNTGDALRTFAQTTSEGIVQTEAVALADTTDTTQVARVKSEAPASDDAGLVVRVAGDVKTSGQKDIFGHEIIVQPYNQVELRLDDADYADFIDTAFVGGGQGGSATQSGGLLNVVSGTAATGSAIVTSKDQVRYRPGVGVYCAGTAVFATAAANSIQRVGMTDTTAYVNSLTFGYNDAGVFGIRYTSGGAEASFTAQADWDDPCMGAPTSQFRRDGTPETLNPLVGNLYRFEAGLFGFAGWVAKVWSPDVGWIPVLTHRHINTLTTPVFTSNTFKVILAATKTSGATSLTLKSQCWGAGTGSTHIRVGSTMFTDRTLAMPVRAVIAGRSTAGGTSYVNVKVNPSGTLAIANTSVGATGAAVPTDATYTGVLSGGNLVGMTQPLTDTQLRATAVPVTDSNQSGTWDYRSGITGTPTIPANARILQISAASALGGSFTINGGNTVTIPPNQALTVEPKGNLVTPTLVFTATDSYFVEFVT